MFPVSWSSRCRRWGCRPMARPRRSPRPRPACCSRPGPVRPAPPSSCRRTTRPRSRRCAPGWTACRWPSNWPRPGARLWAPLSWPHGWMAIPGCCPAVRPARGGTGRWRRWSRGAMSCSTRPNAACWPACRCCAAGSTSARPNGWRPAGRCSRRRSPGCWPAWPASRVVRIQDGAAVRYSLLETIRQFAAGRLAASGEETAVHLRLLDWALGEARSAEATVGSTGWAAWASRLSAGARQHPRRVVVGAGRRRSRRRDGNWPPGWPGGGSPPAGTAKRASS